MIGNVGPGVSLQTYVMTRVMRWTIYCIWQADLLTRRPGPAPVRSWLGVFLAGRVKDRRERSVNLSRCPVDEVECGVTDLCINQLPEKLRQAIVVSSFNPGTADDKARELACDRATFYRRLGRAYDELLGLFNDHEAGVLRVECENPLRRDAPDAVAVKPGPLKKPSLKGISRAVILDKNATLD